ncbi:MAG TPA: hypothetical protein VGP82_02975 [Ktedonobacterales bacterium]|nr:hypothetical protein [Ktedonobacterales bacterium]
MQGLSERHDRMLDVLPALRALGEQHGQGVLLGHWEHKKPFNTPGPLYTGEVDNSGPGPNEAPNNIFADAEGFPFLFRQPESHFELRQVLLAADDDPFNGYGADGDEHWTLEGIRAWWRTRAEMDLLIASLARQVQVTHSSAASAFSYLAALHRWRDYLHDRVTGMEPYLREYAFFLDEGRIPGPEDRLPDL